LIMIIYTNWQNAKTILPISYIPGQSERSRTLTRKAKPNIDPKSEAFFVVRKGIN